MPSDSPAAGKTIGQLKLRTKTGVSVIAVIHDGHTEINPGPETMIDVDDVLVLLGTTDKIHQAIEQDLAAPDGK